MLKMVINSKIWYIVNKKIRLEVRHMPIDTLGWFIAGIFFAAFITLWFVSSYKELTEKRNSLVAIGEQVTLYRKLCMQERGGINEISSQKILSAKIAAYNEALKEYELSLKKLKNYIPAYMMGFKSFTN